MALRVLRRIKWRIFFRAWHSFQRGSTLDVRLALEVTSFSDGSGSEKCSFRTHRSSLSGTSLDILSGGRLARMAQSFFEIARHADVGTSVNIPKLYLPTFSHSEHPRVIPRSPNTRGTPGAKNAVIVRESSPGIGIATDLTPCDRMSALSSVRLLPLLRCQHAALYAGHSRTLSSVVWRPLARHCSAVKPLQTWNSTREVVLRSPFRLESLSRFSTATKNAQDDDKSKKNTVKQEGQGDKAAKLSEEADSKNKEEDNDFDLPSDPKVSFTRKFYINFKKYWYVMVPVHLVSSSAYFLGFCYLASIGISPVPLLEYLGLFKDYIQTVKDSKFAIIGVALVFQKLAAPIRLITTWYIVRALAWRGKLLTSTEFVALVKQYIRKKIGRN